MQQTGSAIVVADLPPQLTALLWSYDCSRTTTIPVIVLAMAVMERGDLAAMRWLLRTIGRDGLRAVFPGLVHRLTPRSAALWRCLLGHDAPARQPVPWTAA